MAGIMGSVGEGGRNARPDVEAVQRALNARLAGQGRRLVEDGRVGPLTIAAIRAFQKDQMRLPQPDGLVEPGRRTWAALAPVASAPSGRAQAPAPTRGPGAAAASRAHSVAADGDARLSGARWWHANQARYPNSSSLDDLASPFQGKAKKFVAALQAAGASVRVSATLRNKARAQLMNYSWRVAKGQLAPADVPAIDGCDIVWDHGDLDTSRKAAREMVRLFHIVFKPSLTSNHIEGTAVDMTITRPSSMTMVDGNGKSVTVGSDAALHTVGASYGVRKLASDPPHWSADGH
jgi:peptidoglycan hydrolase-like protein with peptidoglycan-binding domain